MMGARCDIPNLGDVRGISGGDVPAVDVLTASTPCQSFSEALPNAQRNGLDGKSSLFFEFPRIMKEMLYATGGIYPRYAVWENVGNVVERYGDFSRILDALVSAVRAGCGHTGGELRIPEEPPCGAPPFAGSVCDPLGRFSVGWRVHNARHWGVPQSRSRIALVVSTHGADAAGLVFDAPQKDVLPAPVPDEGTRRSAGGDGGKALVNTDFYPRAVTSPHTGCIRAGSCGSGRHFQLIVDTDGIDDAPPPARMFSTPELLLLQGFPATWLDIDGMNESDKVDLVGNSIALPYWKWLLGRIYHIGLSGTPGATLGSLFDGMGGFPLVWHGLGGRTRWVADIKPAAIACHTHHNRLRSFGVADNA